MERERSSGARCTKNETSALYVKINSEQMVNPNDNFIGSEGIEIKTEFSEEDTEINYIAENVDGGNKIIAYGLMQVKGGHEHELLEQCDEEIKIELKYEMDEDGIEEEGLLSSSAFEFIACEKQSNENGASNTSQKCGFCNKSIAVHAGERVHNCNVNDVREFLWRQDAAQASKAKRTKCAFCNMWFTDVLFADHVKRKPQTCNICQRKFVNKCGLVAHIQSHRMVVVKKTVKKTCFKCEFCEKKFKISERLRKHKIMEHWSEVLPIP